MMISLSIRIYHLHCFFKMRSLAFVIMMFLVGISSAQQRKALRAETEPDYPHIIKVNLFSPLIGTVNVHYEKALSENSSFQLEGFYFTGQFMRQQLDIRGIGLTANYRYYLSKSFPSGWFAQPFIRYQKYWPLIASTARTNDDIQVGTLGMVFGYQVLAAKRLSLDIFAGPMYSKLFANDRRVSNDFIPVFNGPWLRFGGTLGFLF